MPNAAPRRSGVFLALLLIGALAPLTFLSCSGLTPEITFGSLTPSTAFMITKTQTASFYVFTSTVTPPIIEFSSLIPGEPPVVVKGIINAPEPTLKVYAGPGYDFPILGDLNNKVIVDVIGKSQGGWLYVSDSYPDSQLRGWVAAKHVVIERDDLNKIGFVQIVTPTTPPFLP